MSPCRVDNVGAVIPLFKWRVLPPISLRRVQYRNIYQRCWHLVQWNDTSRDWRPCTYTFFLMGKKFPALKTKMSFCLHSIPGYRILVRVTILVRTFPGDRSLWCCSFLWANSSISLENSFFSQISQQIKFPDFGSPLSGFLTVGLSKREPGDWVGDGSLRPAGSWSRLPFSCCIINRTWEEIIDNDVCKYNSRLSGCHWDTNERVGHSKHNSNRRNWLPIYWIKENKTFFSFSWIERDVECSSPPQVQRVNLVPLGLEIIKKYL